jgi:hypothetical protein
MRFLACALLLTVGVAAIAQEHRFELVSYGDLGWRKNNLAGPDFRSPWGGWSETRLSFGGLKAAPTLRAYLKLNLAASSLDIPEENTASYGPGIEYRPFARSRDISRQPALEWINRTRLYAEALRQNFFRSAKPDWNPRHDELIGFDLWREYGAVDSDRPYNRDHWWGELFLGAAYHSTDFYLSDYNSIRSGVNLRAGWSTADRHTPIMPYVDVDLNHAGKQHFFWENRMIGAVGVRCDIRLGERSKIELYAESRRILGYLQDHPLPTDHIPASDYRIGVVYQMNRY